MTRFGPVWKFPPFLQAMRNIAKVRWQLYQSRLVPLVPAVLVRGCSGLLDVDQSCLQSRQQLSVSHRLHFLLLLCLRMRIIETVTSVMLWHFYTPQSTFSIVLTLFSLDRLSWILSKDIVAWEAAESVEAVELFFAITSLLEGSKKQN